MFSHRGLFLAVTTSLASIALADVLVQPGYEHQYDSNPRYLQDQSVPQYWIQSPTEQYRAEQLSDQESTRYLPGVQTVYPYESNQINARSSEPIISTQDGLPFYYTIYPLYYLYRSLYQSLTPQSKQASTTEKNEDPKEAKRKRMEESRRRKQFIHHMGGGRSLQPLMVHNRRKRSDRASIKSEVVAHDNDVVAKSPLTDAKHPTTIDSLLPEHEPTDTTDKRVENRQIKNDYITNPRSFGFYTENMHPGRTYNILNTMQSMIHQFYTNLKPSTAQDEEITNMNMISTAEPSQNKIVGAPYDTNDRPSCSIYYS
ncbi:uncharacterized protein [Temnothorax nylanderi]|uniref:uncharacterized protein n=1 Tax=Temnothorax nylanderi TaxID=102681 RepID=UPI003A88E549